MERVGFDRRAARGIAAGRAKVMQALQIAALALPVADRIIDEFELADATEIRDREDRREDGLQSDIIPFVGEKVHLQELLVRVLLDFDQIGNRDRGLYFRKINSLGGQTVL